MEDKYRKEFQLLFPSPPMKEESKSIPLPLFIEKVRSFPFFQENEYYSIFERFLERKELMLLQVDGKMCVGKGQNLYLLLGRSKLLFKFSLLYNSNRSEDDARKLKSLWKWQLSLYFPLQVVEDNDPWSVYQYSLYCGLLSKIQDYTNGCRCLHVKNWYHIATILSQLDVFLSGLEYGTSLHGYFIQEVKFLFLTITNLPVRKFTLQEFLNGISLSLNLHLGDRRKISEIIADTKNREVKNTLLTLQEKMPRLDLTDPENFQKEGKWKRVKRTGRLWLKTDNELISLCESLGVERFDNHLFPSVRSELIAKLSNYSQ